MRLTYQGEIGKITTDSNQLRIIEVHASHLGGVVLLDCEDLGLLSLALLSLAVFVFSPSLGEGVGMGFW